MHLIFNTERTEFQTCTSPNFHTCSLSKIHITPNPIPPKTLTKIKKEKTDNSKTQVKTAFLLSGQSSDYYWSDVWNEYIAAPTNTTKKQAVYSRLQGMFKYLFGLAEFQLI
jgi:hypothetical protein